MPAWSKATRSPPENTSVVPVAGRIQLGAVASHVLPLPFQRRSRGKAFDVTTKAQVCPHERPAPSVTVKSNQARPVKLTVGVKVATALPPPLWATVPPTTLATVNTGASVKPLVNLRRSTVMLVGDPATFRATVPCGMARKCRYSSSRVYPAGVEGGKNVVPVTKPPLLAKAVLWSCAAGFQPSAVS